MFSFSKVLIDCRDQQISKLCDSLTNLAPVVNKDDGMPARKKRAFNLWGTQYLFRFFFTRKL